MKTHKEKELLAVVKHLEKLGEAENNVRSISEEIKMMEIKKTIVLEQCGEQSDIYAKLDARINKRKEALGNLIEHTIAMDCYFAQLKPFERRMIYMAHVENAPSIEIAYELCMSRATYFRKKKKVLEVMAENMLKDGKLYDEHLTI